MWTNKVKAKVLPGLMSDYSSDRCQCCGRSVAEGELITGWIRRNWEVRKFCPTCQIEYMNVDPDDKTDYEEVLKLEKQI